MRFSFLLALTSSGCNMRSKSNDNSQTRKRARPLHLRVDEQPAKRNRQAAVTTDMPASESLLTSDPESQRVVFKKDFFSIFTSAYFHVVEQSYAYLLSNLALTSFDLPWKTYHRLMEYMRSFETDILSAPSITEVDQHLLNKNPFQYRAFINYREEEQSLDNANNFTSRKKITIPIK